MLRKTFAFALAVVVMALLSVPVQAGPFGLFGPRAGGCGSSASASGVSANACGSAASAQFSANACGSSAQFSANACGSAASFQAPAYQSFGVTYQTVTPAVLSATAPSTIVINGVTYQLVAVK